MPGEIPTVNTNVARQTSSIDTAAQLAKGLGLSEKATEAIKEVAALLGSRSVNVAAAAAPKGEAGTVAGANGVPALDNPDDEKAKEADLEKLVAYLQLENEKEQAEQAKNRIETMKGELEVEHNDRKEKIQKSLDDMESAAKARKRSSIFGWLMTGLAILAAVVACVATGGIAVGAVVGAGIALTAQILNETGAMEKIVGAISKGLQSLGMSKMAADIVAQVAITLVIVAASLGAGGLGSAATGATQLTSTIGQALQHGAQLIKPALTIATGIIGATSTVSSGVGAYQNYKAGMSQADLTETEKYMAIIQQRLDEAEEELQAILEQIQNLVGQIAQLLSSETDTVDEIAMQMGQMA
jgi:hypothetical protein